MRRKSKLARAFILLTLVLSLQTSSAPAQTEFQPTRSGSPIFHVDFVNVSSHEPGMSRLNLYIKTTFEELQFILRDQVYKASYEVSAVVYENGDYQVDGKIDQEEATARDYEETNSRRSYSLSYLTFDLAPGKYKFSISVTDLETKATRSIKKEYVLREFRDARFQLSDLALVRNVEIDSLGIKSFHPDVADFIIDLNNVLYAYFEIYNTPDTTKTYAISFLIRDARRKKIFENKYKRRSEGQRTLEAFQIPANKLSQGIYSVEVSVEDGRDKKELKKELIVRWINMPTSISDIDLAIQQLKYIANKKDFDRIKKSDRGDRLAEFQKYWEHFDPTPGTAANEAMDEYYARIQVANERFSGFREGWKTDMGMIYIIFGPPNDIERHPFDSGYKPYEIWYYHTINREFTFMDEAGFGEYRLITTGWESWRELIK